MTFEPNIDQNVVDLKTVRENAGFTLKDMFERTRISVANLEAIENGNFHLLPVPIYARNFIKTYADALGADSSPVLQRYENYIQAIQAKENNQKKEKTQGDAVGSFIARYKAYLWVFFIIVVFVAVSLYVSLQKKPQTEVSEKPEIKTEAAMPELTVQPDNKPAIDIPKPAETGIAAKVEDKTIDKKPPGKEISKPASVPAGTKTKITAPALQSDAQKVQALVDSEESSVIVISASEETWIRIVADDREPFEALLQPGEKISHKGARFQMDIGNAAGVRIQFNGRNFENLGKTGQVIHLRLP